MKKHLLAFVCLISLFVSSHAEVSIYALNIPGLHQKDGNGEYDNIIHKAVVRSGKAKVIVLPPARAESEFSNCTNCCISPANKNPDFYDYGADAIETAPMSIAKVYIFTGKGKKQINNLDALKGKKVGARIGMPYGKKIDASGIKLKLVSEIQTNIKKLNSGRIDAFVAYVPDAYAAFETLNIPVYPHDKENPIAIHPDSLVCRGTGADFIKDFNSAIK